MKPQPRHERRRPPLRPSTVLPAIAVIVLAISASLALATSAGADEPDPYSLTPDGLVLSQPMDDHDHINVHTTGTNHNFHIEGKCLNRSDAECAQTDGNSVISRHAEAQYIGATFIPWTALVYEGECITWIQVAWTNYHWSDKQNPFCPGSETPPSEPTPTPEPSAPTTPSPEPSPTTATPTPEPSVPASPTPTPEPSTPASPAPSPDPTPSSTPSATPPQGTPTPAPSPSSAPPASTPPAASPTPATEAPIVTTDVGQPAGPRLAATGPESMIWPAACALVLVGIGLTIARAVRRR